MTEILGNPLSRNWQTIQARQPRFSEVMITDAFGRLVAATNKTSDYYQADEQWWQDCYAEGRGRVFLSDIAWDDSALNTDGIPGSLVANLCLPIYADDTRPTTRRASAAESVPPIILPGRTVVGVLKASFDATWLVRQLT